MKWVVSILLLSFNFFYGNSQVLDTIFTLELEPVCVKSLQDQNFTIISRKACSSCVNYVLESKYTTNVLIVTNELSLSEALAIKGQYNLQEKKVYLIVSSSNSIIKIDQSPMILKENNLIVNYQKIEKISKNFTARKITFKRKIKKYST